MQDDGAKTTYKIKIKHHVKLLSTLSPISCLRFAVLVHLDLYTTTLILKFQQTDTSGISCGKQRHIQNVWLWPQKQERYVSLGDPSFRLAIRTPGTWSDDICKKTGW